MTPTASVIIPTDGRKPLQLDLQLESLAAQHEQDFEVIVALNGPCLIDVKPWKTRFAAIRLVPADQVRGKSYAANVGALSACSDILIYLDDDDQVHPGYVTAMGRAIRGGHPYVGARLDVGTLNQPAVRARRAPMQDTTLPTWHGIPFVVGAGLGITRSALWEAGGWNPATARQVDVDLGIRLHLIGITPTLVEAATVAYRYRDTIEGTYAQEYGYGRSEVALWVRYRALVEQQSRWRSAAGQYAALARLWPGRRADEAARYRWATLTGAAAGRLAGSREHRVWYP
jgi:glycosyltransferase involved in cell wall biosynthesis